MIPDSENDFDRFLSSFGSWKGLLDFDPFDAARQESRKLTRPEVRLQ